MKHIKAIFRSDLRALRKNFFALVIVVGLCFLPALYAWFNIHSNWDPYGNTGQIKIAVASADEGYTDEDGNAVNMGEEIVRTLQENTSIHWVVTSRKKAVQSVKSGSCYAAVVLSEDFSQCMYSGFLDDLKRPQVYYYENEKKNAVATKITDTAVSNLKENINEMYVSVLVSHLFAQEAQVTKGSETAAEQLQSRLEAVQETVSQYETALQSLEDADEKLLASMDAAQSDLTGAKTAVNAQSSRTQETSASEFTDTLLEQSRQIASSLEMAAQNVDQALEEQTQKAKNTAYQKALSQVQEARIRLHRMTQSVKTLSLTDSALQKVQGQLSVKLAAQLDSVKKLEKSLNDKLSNKKANISQKTAAVWQAQIQKLDQDYETVVVPLVSSLAFTVDTVNRDLTSALSHVGEDLEILEEVLTGAKSGVSYANTSIEGAGEVLQGLSDKLDSLQELTAHLSNSELVQKVVGFMQGDPEGYGAFFAAPVQIETESIYPVENYGTGVTPFYTTLAIWVGGIFLVSLIKVRPNAKKLNHLKPHELFLGRFLLFFLLGQIQAAIIVIGDLCLLKIQCLNPAAFWLAAAVASFTFMLLIYSLTVSFGDVGKALVVVIVVLQIAGSSGTYPIEILPEFYQKIYIFFPFPYAIDAMREAICGMYEKDYIIYLLELLLFAAAALLLGLVIRLPFRNVNRFMEKRMEDTGFM